jgi:predicted DNA-binding transcriptional regulator AlpA
MAKPDTNERVRLLSRREAAAYCGLSKSGFSRWIKSGLLPPALPHTTRWDIKSIDIALDRLSGILAKNETGSALDDWRAKRAHRSEGNS